MDRIFTLIMTTFSLVSLFSSLKINSKLKLFQYDMFVRPLPEQPTRTWVKLYTKEEGVIVLPAFRSLPFEGPRNSSIIIDAYYEDNEQLLKDLIVAHKRGWFGFDQIPSSNPLIKQVTIIKSEIVRTNVKEL